MGSRLGGREGGGVGLGERGGPVTEEEKKGEVGGEVS